MRLGNREITLGEHYVIEIAGENLVAVPGRNAIRRLLRDWTGEEKSLPSEWDWSLSRPNQPKLTTRISKYYADARGARIPPEIISQIGNIVQQYPQAQSDSYYIDFTNQFDWNVGDFGDHGSCFWGGRNAARDIMRLSGGIAVRFYRDETHAAGFARAWIAPDKPDCEMFIVYNGYGMDEARYGSTRPISVLLSTWMGLDVTQIDLINEGGDSGTLYINGRAGFLVGETNAISRYNFHDLRYVDPSVECFHCENRHLREQCVHYQDEYTGTDRHYCQACAERYIGTCNHCARVLDCDSAHRITHDGRWGDSRFRGVCARCIELYAECGQCGNYHLRTEMTEVRSSRTFSGAFQRSLACLDCLHRFVTCATCNVHFARRRDETRCDRCERESQWQVAEQARRRARQEAAQNNTGYTNSGPPVYQTVYANGTTIAADQIRFTTAHEPDGTIVIRATVEEE